MADAEREVALLGEEEEESVDWANGAAVDGTPDSSPMNWSICA